MKSKKFLIGQTVLIYDRYRFAIPLKGIILKFSETNDGVQLKLIESNTNQYPIGCEDVWVHKAQLRRVKNSKNKDYSEEIKKAEISRQRREREKKKFKIIISLIQNPSLLTTNEYQGGEGYPNDVKKIFDIADEILKEL